MNHFESMVNISGATEIEVVTDTKPRLTTQIASPNKAPKFDTPQPLRGTSPCRGAKSNKHFF